MLGLGVERQLTQGLNLLHQSADRGNAEAREMLQKQILRGHAQIVAAGLTPLMDEGKRAYFPIPDLYKVAAGQQVGRAAPPVTELKSATVVKGVKSAAAIAAMPWSEVVPTPPRPPISASDAQRELNGLIGLAGPKQQVKTLINRQRLDSLRAAQGLPATEMTLHLVFTGNPGTGKTTVARLLGAILHDAGLLSRGHVIEVTDKDLIGEYVGGSGPRVAAKVQEAMGGILFIDEAYNLITAIGSAGPANSFSMSAITTLVQLMETHKGEFMVIAAGYPKEMQDFVNFNPGLQSRFRETIHFENFTDEELAQVFEGFADQNKYTLAEGSRETLVKIMHDAPARFSKTFGNARYVRNVFEETLERVANRIAHVASPTLADLTTITAFDIRSAAEDFARQDMLRKRQQY
ncbi:MAG: AAA family ATPase [bacterium]|nr:AAA family ATPase [bacterium]